LNIRIRNELIPLNLLVIILIIVIAFFPTNVFRIILALPSLLFFPGYVLIAALYPRKERMEAIERIALSFGISIVIVPIIGLILNYSPWGIALKPALYLLSSFTFVTSFIAWLRRRRLPDWEKLSVEFQLRLPVWDGKVRDRVLSTVLVCAIVGTVGMTAYILASPKGGEQFTEFYVLDESGAMTQYPRELNPGTPGRVVLDIVNHEYQEVAYHIVIKLSGEIINEVGPITIQDGQEWEQEVGFTPISVGDDQKLEFLLFKEGGGRALSVTPSLAKC